MLLKKVSIMISLFCVMTFIGCDEPDGKWDSIQITVNEKTCKSNTFDVSAEGGEYRVYSKNYGTLWLIGVKENGNRVWPNNHDYSDYQNIHLTESWYELQYDERGNIVVIIQPIEKDNSSRNLYLELEHGDAFGSITFVQD